MCKEDDLSCLTGVFADAVTNFQGLLLQSRRAFLLGAGCSTCAGLPLTDRLITGVLSNHDLSDVSKEIITAIASSFTGAPNANIEDYLSELIDLLAIARRRFDRRASNHSVTLDGKSYAVDQLEAASYEIKNSIAAVIDRDLNLNIHRDFVRAIHQPVRVGKRSAGHVVDYLILNYDTALEDSLALERVLYADGIEGGRNGWWDPASFGRLDVAAKVLKLHGSIDWCEIPADPLPRRLDSRIQGDHATTRRVIIWPAATKYRETQLDPYAQLTELARLAMKASDGSQLVLVICGYSYSDGHVNHEVDRALRESDGNLTVAAFTSEDEPTGILGEWHNDVQLKEQVLIYSNRGFFHGDSVSLAQCDLPWWKFQNVVRIIAGEI